MWLCPSVQFCLFNRLRRSTYDIPATQGRGAAQRTTNAYGRAEPFLTTGGEAVAPLVFSFEAKPRNEIRWSWVRTARQRRFCLSSCPSTARLRALMDNIDSGPFSSAQMSFTSQTMQQAGAVNPPSPTNVTVRSPVASVSAACTLLGHKVHHTRLTQGSCTACVRCGAAILDLGHSVSRVAHTLSCFFGWHHYVAVATRSAHNEYVCERCGHPLLFESARDPHSSHHKFKKKVDYLCGLLGHRVHIVKTGSKTTEYACGCGHSFIKAEKSLTVIRHPLACVLRGHFVKVNEIRGDWIEYVCVRCGHPFCFRLAASGQFDSELEQLYVRSRATSKRLRRRV
jgi:DNA-directed RNA polymerase subunit RPC12/RpoP